MDSNTKMEMYLAIKKNPERSNKRIATQFGVSAATVHRFRKKHDLPSNPSTKLGNTVGARGVRSTERKKGTKEREAEIRYYIKEHPNRTLREMGEDLGIPETTIGNIIKRNNISYDRKIGRVHTALHDEDVLEVVTFIENHAEMTIKEIAEHYGSSTKAVRNFIKKHGVRYVSKRMSMVDEVPKEEMEEVLREHPDWVISQIGEYFGYGESSVRRYIEKYQLPYRKKNKV